MNSGSFDEFDRVPLKLADLITHEDDVEIIATLRAAMKAEVMARAPRLKGGENNYAAVPDWAVRVSAAKILAEMKHGRPQQSVSLTVSEAKKPMTRLQAARELMENWEDIRRIGDEHVRLLQQAIPRLTSGVTEIAVNESVDVDLPG